MNIRVFFKGENNFYIRIDIFLNLVYIEVYFEYVIIKLIWVVDWVYDKIERRVYVMVIYYELYFEYIF